MNVMCTFQFTMLVFVCVRTAILVNSFYHSLWKGVSIDIELNNEDISEDVLNIENFSFIFSGKTVPPLPWNQIKATRSTFRYTIYSRDKYVTLRESAYEWTGRFYLSNECLTYKAFLCSLTFNQKYFVCGKINSPRIIHNYR